MWVREELKDKAKVSFKAAYWKCVGVCVILGIVGGILGGDTSSSNSHDSSYTNQTSIDGGIADGIIDINGKVGRYTNFSPSTMTDTGTATAAVRALTAGLSAIAVVTIMLVGIFMFVLRLVILHPLSIGQKRFFMTVREDKDAVKVKDILYIYQKGKTWSAVSAMFFVELYTLLWTLLFIIPGIIKYYEYKMVPYILSENPDIGTKQAFKLSKQMMMGNKMDTFVLGLSFIGWMILSVLTLGLLGIFYVTPYITATDAELYAVLREDVLNSGVASEEDLPGFSTNTPLEVFA